MRRQIWLVYEADMQNEAEERRWLASQGLSTETLPRRATWYRADGVALPGLPTDSYHRALYRGKGWTLKPPLGVSAPGVGKAPQATRPASLPTCGPAAKPRMPRLARGILRVMEGKDTWEGTATELMALLDPYAPPGGRPRRVYDMPLNAVPPGVYPYRVNGMPLNAARLSKEIKAPKVTAALEAFGVTVSRGYRGHERVLRLSRLWPLRLLFGNRLTP